MNPVVYAADIGSIAGGNFGWSRIDPIAEASVAERRGGTQINELIGALEEDLDERRRTVAMGFECPLMVPVPEASELLGKARAGDGNRAWSAGPGASALATGITQTAWILSELRNRCPEATAYLDWDNFTEAQAGLFLWEAFVTGAAKSATHVDDALIAARTFVDALPDPRKSNAVSADRPLSVIGAALLWSGWTTDPAVLHQPCLVIKSDPVRSADRRQFGLAAEAATTMSRSSVSKLCLCGCGASVARRFRPGHDAKLKYRLLHAMNLGDPDARDRLKELGWLPADRSPWS